MNAPIVWKTCSSCKKPILLSQVYFECSVSTCTGDRTGYVFCSVPCWERHLPGARHRDAGAIEKRSPSQTGSSHPSNTGPQSTNLSAPRRIIVGSNANQGPAEKNRATSMEQEILIVVSKLKTYINEKSEMNTSGEVAELLSHKVRRLCDEAMDHARSEGRKTVMARDFK